MFYQHIRISRMGARILVTRANGASSSPVDVRQNWYEFTPRRFQALCDHAYDLAHNVDPHAQTRSNFIDTSFTATWHEEQPIDVINQDIGSETL